MASGMFVIGCIIAVCALNHAGAERNFQVSSINIGGSNPTQFISFECTTDPRAVKVFELQIGRVENGVLKTIIIKDVNDENYVSNHPSLAQRVADVETTVPQDKSSIKIKFSLKEPRCTDGNYQYYCSGFSRLPDNENNPVVIRNISVTTFPSDIEMIPTPRKTEYSVGEPVEIRCTGNIGNQFNENRIWEWESRVIGDSFPSAESSWAIWGGSENISRPDGPPRKNGCQYQDAVVFRHVISSNDENRQVRCRVYGEPDTFNGNFTFRFQTTTSKPGEQNPVDAGGPEVGVIVGAVIGALAAIVLIIVLVYFLVFRRKSGGDDYDTGEGKGDRPEVPDNVVYTTPASHKPSHVKGRENDALDEPHEKNPRGYYANDFGRSNPAMDDDDRHNRSYDDDNTDTRGRAPYGSAV